MDTLRTNRGGTLYWAVVKEKKIMLSKQIHMAAKQRSRSRKADRKASFRKLNLI